MSINVTVSGSSSINVTTSSSNLLNLSAQGYTLHANTHENGGVDPIDHNLLRGIQGGQSNEYYHLTSGQYANFNNIVYISGNQNISGTKNFYTRPQVNGSGVLLDGESLSISVAEGISGLLQGQITTLNNQTGSYYPRSNPSGFITGVNLTSYVTTGQTGAFYAASNPSGFITGVNLTSYVTTAQTGAFYAASNPSGFITGVDLSSYATTGYVTGASGVLQTQITTLNNKTGSYYLNTNPSGYISGTVPISSGGTSSTTASGARTALDVPSLTLANSFAGVQSFPNQVLASASNALTLANLGAVAHYTRSLFPSCTPSVGGTGATSRRVAVNGIFDGDVSTSAVSGSYYNIRIANTLDSAYDVGSVDFRHPWSLMFRLLLMIPANSQILFELGCAGGLNSVPTGGINAGLIFDSNTSCRLWRCNSTAPVYSLSGSLSAANIPSAYSVANEQFVWIDNDGVGNLTTYAISRAVGSSLPYKPTTPICSLSGVPLSNSDPYLGVNIRVRANGVPAAMAFIQLRDAKFTEL